MIQSGLVAEFAAALTVLKDKHGTSANLEIQDINDRLKSGHLVAYRCDGVNRIALIRGSKIRMDDLQGTAMRTIE